MNRPEPGRPGNRTDNTLRSSGHTRREAAAVARAARRRYLSWLLGPQEQRGGRANGDNSWEYGCEIGEQHRAERDRTDV
jgi:hypothetical protein